MVEGASRKADIIEIVCGVSDEITVRVFIKLVCISRGGTWVIVREDYDARARCTATPQSRPSATIETQERRLVWRAHEEVQGWRGTRTSTRRAKRSRGRDHVGPGSAARVVVDIWTLAWIESRLPARWRMISSRHGLCYQCWGGTRCEDGLLSRLAWRIRSW